VFLRAAVASNIEGEVTNDYLAPEPYLTVHPDGTLHTSRSKSHAFEIVASPCVPDSGPAYFIKSHYIVTGQERLTQSGTNAGDNGKLANLSGTYEGEVFLHTNQHEYEYETWALIPAAVAGPPRWIIVSWHHQRLVVRNGGVLTVEAVPAPNTDAFFWTIELAGAPARLLIEPLGAPLLGTFVISCAAHGTVFSAREWQMCSNDGWFVMSPRARLSRLNALCAACSS
jgi:hypothetical protein